VLLRHAYGWPLDQAHFHYQLFERWRASCWTTDSGSKLDYSPPFCRSHLMQRAIRSPTRLSILLSFSFSTLRCFGFQLFGCLEFQLIDLYVQGGRVAVITYDNSFTSSPLTGENHSFQFFSFIPVLHCDTLPHTFSQSRHYSLLDIGSLPLGVRILKFVLIFQILFANFSSSLHYLGDDGTEIVGSH